MVMADRESAARAVLGSLRLEGLEPSQEMRMATERWARSEADVPELLAVARRTAQAGRALPPARSDSDRV
jgi:hypothetical protein